MHILTTAILAGLTFMQSTLPDRALEGNWYVSDDTDNNTGERKVYAFATHLKADDPNYVTMRFRCSLGRPIVSIEWDNVSFPDQSVLSIELMGKQAFETAGRKYVFETSSDPVERGLMASPETSADIVKYLGEADQAAVTAHLAPSSRMVDFKISGTQRAWNRVVRHCPIRRTPLPPL